MNLKFFLIIFIAVLIVSCSKRDVPLIDAYLTKYVPYVGDTIWDRYVEVFDVNGLPMIPSVKLNDEEVVLEDYDLTQWWFMMEFKYSKIPLENKPSYNDYIKKYGGVHFFRENYSMPAVEITAREKPFRKATDEYIYENDLFDFENECGSGCQVFY